MSEIKFNEHQEELIILNSEDREVILQQYMVLLKLGVPQNFEEVRQHSTALSTIAKIIFTEEEKEALSDYTSNLFMDTVAKLIDAMAEEEGEDD